MDTSENKKNLAANKTSKHSNTNGATASSPHQLSHDEHEQCNHTHDHGSQAADHRHDSYDHGSQAAGHRHDSHDHGSHATGHQHDSHDHGSHAADHQHDSHDHGSQAADHQHDSHDHDAHDHDHAHQGHSHAHHGHSHGHAHGHHGHHHHHGPNNKAGLLIALIITSGIMILEFVGGLVTNSLALLSDSGHMLSDAGALALSLAAMYFAARPASKSRTYGFHRFEILAALLNGVALFVIAAFIVAEAIKRFAEPPTVASGSMMLIAIIGLLANLASAWFLMRKADIKDNLNVRSAYLHVLGDALGSVGAIVAGILMSLFSWYIADPIISVVVALLILKSAWGIIKSTVHILMEGTPHGIDADEVKAALLRIDGVKDVHDLHIWTITSGLDSLSGHLLVDDSVDCQLVLQQAIRIMAKDFHIEHTTIQIEKSGLSHAQCKV